MTLAGRHFVSMPELEVAAGKRIAEMLKLPDGYTALVTSGAAAAIQSGLAGILTGEERGLDPATARPHRDEVGSDYSEVASQSV